MNRKSTEEKLDKGSFSCLLCKGTRSYATITAKVKGDASNALKVVKCESCGHVQLNPPAYSAALYNEDGQVNNAIHTFGTPFDKIVEHSWIEARRRIARFSERGITLNSRSTKKPFCVLDVGGGYGFFASEAMSVNPDWQVIVLEPSRLRIEKGLAYLQNQRSSSIPEFQNRLLDREYVEENAASFDMVTLWHVLEHVADPVELLRNACALLRDGGMLCVEVPNLDDDLNKLSPSYCERSFMIEHISYFTPSTLELTAIQAIREAEIIVYGYQRYGIFNYCNWIYTNAPQGANPDMFDGRDRMWIESTWRHSRESARTSDALFMTVTKERNPI